MRNASKLNVQINFVEEDLDLQEDKKFFLLNRTFDATVLDLHSGDDVFVASFVSTNINMCQDEVGFHHASH